jgi:hypothetical protein
MPADKANNSADSAACTRPFCAMLKACGCALAKSGVRANDHSAPDAATPVPPSAIASPDNHQTGRSANCPETSAP